MLKMQVKRQSKFKIFIKCSSENMDINKQVLLPLLKSKTSTDV